MLEPFTKFDELSPEVFKHKTLDVLSYAIAQQIGLAGANMEMELVNLPERMAQQFILRFRLPGEVIQDNRLMCEYPERGVLNAIRYELALLGERFPRTLGFLRKAMPVVNQLRVYQSVVYPDVGVHPDMEKVRIFYQDNLVKVLP
jgi:hypothetical protein